MKDQKKIGKESVLKWLLKSSPSVMTIFLVVFVSSPAYHPSLLCQIRVFHRERSYHMDKPNLFVFKHCICMVTLKLKLRLQYKQSLVSDFETVCNGGCGPLVGLQVHHWHLPGHVTATGCRKLTAGCHRISMPVLRTPVSSAGSSWMLGSVSLASTKNQQPDTFFSRPQR